ncbi:hypothetical protein LTR84_008920 [Exophiala bonariae]|uniref:Uncharacterized protein n=1 Tax=Exophiala bonariae TaxID=1690606 RepID=A0AAV9MWA3_9EURO|nr:hypothetical protein LTR84_008920 [Exophiala bonariae]
MPVQTMPHVLDHGHDGINQTGNRKPRRKIPGSSSWRIGPAPTKFSLRHATPRKREKAYLWGQADGSEEFDNSSASTISPDLLKAAKFKYQLIQKDVKDDVIETLNVCNVVSDSPKSPNRPQLPIRDTMLDQLESGTRSLSPEERNMVVRYLQFAPDVAYGTNGSGMFCPNRDMNWKSVQHCKLGLQHILIDCEALLSISKGHQPPASMLYRKAKFYKSTAKLLGEPETQTSDLAIACVCSAIAIESRSLNLETNRIHLKGLARMLQLCGFESLFSNATFMFHPLSCLGFFVLAELETSDMAEAQVCSRGFFRILSTMQGIAGKKITLHRGIDGVTNNSTGLRDSVPERPWWNTAEESPIHPHIIALLCMSAPDDAVSQRTSRFLSLFLLNIMLYDFQDAPSEGRYLLNRVSTMVDSSSAIDLQTQVYKLKVEIIPWILAKSWADVDAVSLRKGSGSAKEIFLTKAAMDALKVFARLPEDSKIELVATLTSWLGLPNMIPAQGVKEGFRANKSQGHAMFEGRAYVPVRNLSQEAFEKMRAEVCSDWYENGKRRNLSNYG